MLKNYFKIAWRNLLRSKAYSAIHIIGLSIGMAAALMIGLWIWDEVSFNTYHDNYKELGQVGVTQTFNGSTGTGMTVAIPLSDELRTRYADNFKYVSLASSNDEHILSVGEIKVAQAGMWVQPDFPVMFTLRMEKGSQQGLKDPSSILITASLAKTLFGDADPINKIIRVDNKGDMQVTGVFEDLPRNTTFYDTKFLLPWDNLISNDAIKDARTDWDNHLCKLFVQLGEHADFDKTTQKIKGVSQPHVKGYKEEVMLHPMSKWHLYSDFKNGKVAGGRIQFVWLFGIIGVFVLLLACINFMNLSTARSERRAKEVGIRKAVGSLRGQLIAQFLSESVLVAFLAFLLSIILVLSTLPFFNRLADKSMSIPWSNPFFWLLALGFTLLTGLIAGSYPAFYLSSFEPIKVLKGIFRAGRFAALPRKILVVLQFTISITLITGTIIVFRQIQFAKSRPVGYTREGLITVAINTPEIQGHYNALRDDLIHTGAVENMAESSSPITHIYNNNKGFAWSGMDPNEQPLFRTINVTHDFGKTIGWDIKAGRDFSREYITDSGALILNETAAKITGLKNPIGSLIQWNGISYPIAGVVKDMLTQSPYEPMQPTIFFLSYAGARVITIRVMPTMSIRDALAKIEPVFKRYNPDSPFAYQFTDMEYAKKFFDEQSIGDIATFFAILAIFISCLGLFGLASFVTEQRTKEIGVRKILGASTFSLWSLLSKEFVRLVMIACIISVPISWYYLNQWLQKYEYRTAISWWIFIAAAISALVITLLTVSFQTIKAAFANPSKSLRSE